jgi:hypothetical protein
MFARWACLRGGQPVPASPADVANFITDITSLGIEKILRAVDDISRAHFLRGLADPTLGPPVSMLLSELAKIEPPRAWPKEQKAEFARLQPDMQKFIAEFFKRQDVVVKRAMQEASDARKAANLPKLPKHFFREKVTPNGNIAQSAA